MEVAFLTPDQASQLKKETEERAARARAAAVAQEEERSELKVVQRAKALECRAARDGITALKRDLETLEANLQAAEEKSQQAWAHLKKVEKDAPADWDWPTDRELEIHAELKARAIENTSLVDETVRCLREAVSELKAKIKDSTAELDHLAAQELAMRSKLAGRPLYQ